MPYFVVFLFEVFLLAALTSHSSSHFLRFFNLVLGSEKAAIILFSIIFFPGTFIHELAHFLMAKLLFVYVGKMEFFPQVQGDAIKLGSVSVAKTDPIRRLLIGVAPVILGLTVLLGTLWGIQNFFNYFSSYPWWIWLCLGYVVFVTGSTMFSSRKDLEGSLGVVIGVILLIIAAYLLGIGWILNNFFLFLVHDLNDFFKQLSLLLTIPLGINVGVLILGLLGKFKV